MSPRQSDKKRRVAVVVFCEADGVDDVEASLTAVRAIRVALSADPRGAELRPLTVDFYRDGEVFASSAVSPVAVMDAGMAAGNGYLWTAPAPP